MPKRTLKLDMDEIFEGLASSPEDPTRYLDLETGEVSWFFDRGFDDDSENELRDKVFEDPERYLVIERIETRDQYRWMEQFAESVEDEDVRAKLMRALDGKGAFGHFYDFVRRDPALEADWERMRREILLEAATSLLAQHDIEPVYELPPLPEPARPTPAKKPPIDLIDMLLLGAPDGKTELIDGRVFRIFPAKDKAEAQSVFRHLARAITEYHGLAWRKRFVENRTTYSVERMHLELRGTTVEIAVDVSSSTWNRFR